MGWQTEAWKTPGGNSVRMSYRPETSDWNTVSAILTHDEYGMPAGRSGLFVDVGAHIGAWTIGAAVDNPAATVIAIEPLPENVDLIRANITLNGLDDRVVVMAAAAGDNGRIRYGATGTDFEAQHEYIGGAVWQEDPTARIVTVPTVVMDDLVGLVEVLKIDCEGCEWPFLRSPGIARVREIVGEYHPRDGHGPAYLRGLLEESHDVTLDDSLDFGPFRAVRK